MKNIGLLFIQDAHDRPQMKLILKTFLIRNSESNSESFEKFLIINIHMFDHWEVI